MNDTSQLIALLRRLSSADGDISIEESRWLRKLLSELPPETDATAEFDPEKFKSLVADEGDAEELLRVMLLVSLSDGQTSPEEWAVIQETAALLNFSSTELEKLRSETVLTAEPYS